MVHTSYSPFQNYFTINIESSLFILVTQSNLTRKDKDGMEWIVGGLCILAIGCTLSSFPLAIYIFKNPNVALYKHFHHYVVSNDYIYESLSLVLMSSCSLFWCSVCYTFIIIYCTLLLNGINAQYIWLNQLWKAR